MSTHGDDRDTVQHRGATERNGPGQEADLDYLQEGIALTRNETMATLQDEESHHTQGKPHVGEGMDYLNPSLAADFTGLEQDELQGVITSVMGSLSQQAAAIIATTEKAILFWHREHFRSSATASLRPKRKSATAKHVSTGTAVDSGSSSTSEGGDQDDLPEVCHTEAFLEADLPTAMQLLHDEQQKQLTTMKELSQATLQDALIVLLTKTSAKAFHNGHAFANAGAEEELTAMQDYVSGLETQLDSLRSSSQAKSLNSQDLLHSIEERKRVEAGLDALQETHDVTVATLKNVRAEVTDLKNKLRLADGQLTESQLQSQTLQARYQEIVRSESELRETVLKLRKANEDGESSLSEANDQVTKYQARQLELVELISMWNSMENKEGQMWQEVGRIRNQLAEGLDTKGMSLTPEETKTLEAEYKAKTQWILDDSKLLTERKKAFMRRVMGVILHGGRDVKDNIYKPPTSNKPTREELQNSIVRFVQNNPERYFALAHIIHRIMHDWTEENNQFWLIDFRTDVEPSLLPEIESQSKNLYEALKLGLDCPKHSWLWLKAVSDYSNGTKGESRKAKPECGIEATHALMSITCSDDIKNTLRINDRLSSAWRDFAMKYPHDVIQDQRRLLVRAQRLKLVKMKVEDITKIIEVLRAREERLADLAQIYSEETGQLKDVAHEKALPFYGEFLCKVEKLILRIEQSEEPAKITKKWKINALKVTDRGSFTKHTDEGDTVDTQVSAKSLKERIKRPTVRATAKKSQKQGKSSEKLTCMAANCKQKSGLFRNRKDGTPWGNQENLIALCDSCKRDTLKGDPPRLKNGRPFEKYETNRGYPAFRYCDKSSGQARSARVNQIDRDELRLLIRDIATETSPPRRPPARKEKTRFSTMRMGDMTAAEIQEHLSNMTGDEFQEYWQTLNQE